MNALKYPHLYSPIRIGNQVFRNRIFAAPTGWIELDKGGKYNRDAAYYYGRKAKGGAAAVTLGECNIMTSGAGFGYAVKLDEQFSGGPYILHGISSVVEEVTRYGAVCSAELIHAGMYAGRWMDPPAQAYGPVECDDIDGRHILQMPEEMIYEIAEKFASGAKFLKSIGFGMLMVHAGHGWLLHQFLSPVINTRTDRWGGPDIENRTRFLLLVLDKIREAVGPGFPIECRISGSECYDGGFDIETGIAVAKMIDGHCDIIHVSAGSHEVEEVFTVTHPSMFREDGCNVQFAAAIKPHVKRSLVATLGGLVEPAQMEEILASGKADIVEIARGLMADPDLPNKCRAGREEDVTKCMRCLACFSNLILTGHFRCAINPETGREQEVLLPAAVKKKVMIAGGGIAGMEAAVICAQRGHDVTLFEKTGRMGGSLRCEENVPFKKRVKEYMDLQAKRVYDAGVDVRLNTCATPEEAEKLQPDVIISCLGAESVKLRLPGIDGPNVLSCDDAYVTPEKLGGSVVILGAGLVGLELAVYLSMLGKKVSVIEMLDRPNDGGNFQHMKGLQAELDKYGVEISFETRAAEIDERGVVCEKGGETVRFDADHVIYAVGRRPVVEETYALAACAPEFYPIGDCLAAKNIMNATSQAYKVAAAI